MIDDHRLPANVFEKIPALTQGLENLKVAQALYFFGSLARGELKPLSDLDFPLLQGAYAKVRFF